MKTTKLYQSMRFIVCAVALVIAIFMQTVYDLFTSAFMRRAIVKDVIFFAKIPYWMFSKNKF